MRPSRTTSILLLGLAFIGLVSVQAEVVFLNPSADATLLEVAPNNSIGGHEFFIAGTTQNNTRNRGLLQFDVASVVPPGSTINNITLDLEVVRQPGCGFEALYVGLHRVLRPWGEGTTLPDDNMGGRGGPAAVGDATWLYRYAFSDPWALPGGAPDIDYISEFSGAAFIFAKDVYQFEAAGAMLADVEFWANHPESNFGWMLIAENEDTAFTARAFASKESGGPPVLAIDFTPVPEPSTILLFAAGLLGFFGFWRRNARRN